MRYLLALFFPWAVPTSPLRLDLSPAPTTRRSSPHRLISASCKRFGRLRAHVEERIRRFLGNLPQGGAA